jgi:hypothetical protein
MTGSLIIGSFPGDSGCVGQDGVALLLVSVTGVFVCVCCKSAHGTKAAYFSKSCLSGAKSLYINPIIWIQSLPELLV